MRRIRGIWLCAYQRYEDRFTIYFMYGFMIANRRKIPGPTGVNI